MLKETLRRYMLIGVGLMVAVGFSGIFIYAPLVNTPERNSPEQEINATLPQENFSPEGFGLSVQEQAYLAVNEQVVFVNVMYDNDSTVFEGLETLPDELNDRIYVNMINSSESAFAANYNLDTPSALVIGDQPTRSRGRALPYSIATAEPDRESIIDAICQSMREPGDLAATCFT